MLGYIKKHYRDKNPHTRWSVAKALGKLGDPTVLPVLEWMVEHDKGGELEQPYAVRDAACEAIAEIKLGKNLTFENLINALKHEDSAVRELAVLRLRNLGNVRAIPFLEEMAHQDKGKGCKGRSLKDQANYTITVIRGNQTD